MPVTKEDILKEMARRELARRKQAEPSTWDKTVDAVKSFDETMSRGSSTGAGVLPWMQENLFPAMGINPRTEGSDVGRLATNTPASLLRMPFELIGQLIDNPYEFVAGIPKMLVGGAKTMGKAAVGDAAATEEILNNPLLPAMVAAPAFGLAARGMTPASLRGVDLNALKATATEAAKTSSLLQEPKPFSTANLLPKEQVALAEKPLLLADQSRIPNVVQPKPTVVRRGAMTPDQWREWINQEEANAPKVTRYITSSGNQLRTAKTNATPMQVRMNKGVSEIDPTVPKTEAVVSKPQQVPTSADVSSPTPPVTKGGETWNRTGKEVGQVYHGSSTGIVGDIDMSKTGQRDSGFYGKGFYVTKAPKYAKTYGDKVSELQFADDAKVLDVGTIHPQFENKINPSLQSELESFHRQELISKGSERAKANPEFPDNYLSMIKPDGGSFDLKTWIGVVDRFAESKGFDAVRWSDGEIVVKNAKAVKPPTSVKTPVGKGGEQSRAAGFDPALLSGMAEKATPTFLKSAEARIKLPESKQMFNEIKLADETRGVMEGGWLEDLKKLGLKKLNDKGAEELGSQLNKGTGGQPYATILERVWTEAKNAGIEIGKVKNYFPRIIKREIAEKMYDDTRPIITELKKGELTDQAVAKALEKADKRTRDIIQHVVDEYKREHPKSKGFGYRNAVEQIYYAARHDLFKVTSFEKHRSLKTELPSWVYETDARQVLPMYVEAMSKRIADAKVWGPNLEGATETLTKIRNSDMKEAATVEQVLKTHTGTLQQERALGPTARKIVDKASAAEYGLKIGGGTATIPNVTQTLISTAQEYGYPKTLKAIANLVVSPEARSTARRSGAVNHDMMQAMTGYHPAGVWGKAADLLTTVSGFKGINKINQYVAAETGRVAMVDYYAAAKKPGKYGEWAKQRLADIGVDPAKPLTDDVLARAMYRVATDTQLQKNILKDPLWLNDPRWQWLGIFKRFGYRQFKYQKDMLQREAKRGNYMPMLRLAVGGYLGGEFVVWAKNRVRETLSGEPAYREDEHLTWERLLNNVAAIGSLGVFSDIAGGVTGPNPATSTAGKATFALTPLAGQELAKGSDLVRKVAGDYDKYGTEVAVRRNVPDVLQQLSPLAGQVGERLSDKASKENRAQSFKGKKRTEILDDFIDGNREDAIRKFKLWNENHPKDKLKPSDVGAEEQRKRKLMKRKVQAGGR